MCPELNYEQNSEGKVAICQKKKWKSVFVGNLDYTLEGGCFMHSISIFSNTKHLLIFKLNNPNHLQNVYSYVSKQAKLQATNPLWCDLNYIV